MTKFCKLLFVVVFVTIALAQTSDIPLNETRLTIHTLVREDIFAGFLENDLKRLARGEKSVEALLVSRPNFKAELLAWKAGAQIYRAVLAHEKNNKQEFQQRYKDTLAWFDEAIKLSPNNGGVHSVRGGSFELFADRLPKELQAEAWAKAYESFSLLYKQQAASIAQMPVHFKGEVLGGLAQSAQRTGHTAEMNMSVDKILEVLANTPYENVAKQWKKNPASAANTSITCLSCHEPGRLMARIEKINAK